MYTIETILSRAMNDVEFAELLLANPTEALAEYDLSAEELAHFKGMSRADFEAFTVTSPEERKSLASQLSAGDLADWRTNFGRSG